MVANKVNRVGFMGAMTAWPVQKQTYSSIIMKHAKQQDLIDI